MEAFPGRGKERKIGAQRERERERERERDRGRGGEGRERRDEKPNPFNLDREKLIIHRAERTESPRLNPSQLFPR